MRMQGFFFSWLVGFYFDIFQNKLLPKLGFGVEGLREGCSPLLCILKLFYMNQKSLFEENCQLCKETRRGRPAGRAPRHAAGITARTWVLGTWHRPWSPRRGLGGRPRQRLCVLLVTISHEFMVPSDFTD